MNTNAAPLPLHIARALQAAEKACAADSAGLAHDAVLRLAAAITYHLSAVAVGQYSQALYTGQVEPDPTLNRSLRSLRRVLPGQWLGWAARGLELTPAGPVQGLGEWYAARDNAEIAVAYEALRTVMVGQMAYTGEYGPRPNVPPRVLLEMVDQYNIRRNKTSPGAPAEGTDAQVTSSLLDGLRAMLDSANFLRDYPLFAPQQRQLLMGLKPTVPMPPMTAPADAAATILLYPPGEAPDYTKRPNLQAERLPLFPLDPLLAYLRCEECDRFRVAALREVEGGLPTYEGLDPECGHPLKPAVSD